MSNFIETVKGFYSQRYYKVYHQGQPLNIKVIKPDKNLSFYIHGLAIKTAEELQENKFVYEYKHQLRFAFYLEGFEAHRKLHLNELRKFYDTSKSMAFDIADDSKVSVNLLPNSV